MTVHTENEALFQRASRCLAGGVLSNFKKAKGVAPVYVKSAEGCRMTDYDGNVYYDFSLSAGPAILGHSNEGLRRALREQLDQAYTNRDCLAAIEAAEKIQQVVPCAELVRFAVSGVDAVFNAIRVARAYTGRPLYVKFKGQYNGGMDFVLGGCTDRGDLLAEYNDLEGLAALFQQQGDQIACVIMEPVTLNMTGCMPEPGFLEGLRELCTRYGVLMVFDETLTGFRLALGGAQEYFGVRADLVTFGKIIGGGMPVGAYCGSRALLEQVAPCGPVYQAGTLSGNPVAMAAGLAQLTYLREHPEVYEHINARGAALAEGLRELVKRTGAPVVINQLGSLLAPFFTPTAVTTFTDAKGSDVAKYARYFQGMLERGVALAPAQFEAMFVSEAHTQAELDATLAAAEAVFQTL